MQEVLSTLKAVWYGIEWSICVIIVVMYLLVFCLTIILAYALTWWYYIDKPLPIFIDKTFNTKS